MLRSAAIHDTRSTAACADTAGSSLPVLLAAWHDRHRLNWASNVASVLVVILATLLFSAATADAKSRFNAAYFSSAEVIDQNGKTYKFYDDLIAGKAVVINFLYLNCNDICPLTSSRVAALVDRLGAAAGRDVFVYSITMDPERDKPADLKAYYEAFGSPPGWTLLTGSVDDIRILRWRLGERSRSLNEHRNDVVLGNDRTGEWSRSSMYADIEMLAKHVAETARIAPLAGISPTATKSDPAAPENRMRYSFNRPLGEALFIKACSTCHSIGGGRRIGPDLKDVTVRRGRDWLERFIADPGAMRRGGDATALEISKEFSGVIMPNLGLQKVDIEDVLSYIELRSQDDAADHAASKDGSRDGSVTK